MAKVIPIKTKNIEKMKTLYRKNLLGVILQDTLEEESKKRSEPKQKEENDGKWNPIQTE